MKVSEMNWMQLEAQLKVDDRAIVPLGCTEQHAYLSLATDSLLAERLATDVGEALKLPVFPVIAYGLTPTFMAYPGTITLRLETLIAIVRDVLDSLAKHGFKRVLIVNGHGGNAPVRSFILEWMAAHPGVQVKFHDWWNAPEVAKVVQGIDPIASHASWMENFPWTRVAGVTPPDTQKPVQPYATWTHMGPAEIRRRLGDGNFAGRYVRSDAEMLAIWQAAVAETRALLESGWA